MTILVGGLLSTSVALNIWREYKDQNDLLEQRGVELVKLLANAISSPLWSMDTDAVNNTLQLVTSDPDYMGVVIRELDGPQMVVGDFKIERSAKHFTHHIIHHDTARDKKVKIGDIELILSTDQLQDFLYNKILEDALLLLLLLLLNVVAIYRTLRLIRYPMEQLTESMRQFSNGNYQHSVYGLDRPDEIGVMAESLEILRHNSIEREEIKGELEQRVLERTHSLEKEVEERKQAEQRARAADKSKSAFLANMSHEIRTPMNGVIGLSHLTLQCDLSPEVREYLNKIQLSANSLLSIINDILDFSKIEADQLYLEKIDFELKKVLNQVSSIVMLKAKEKGLAIELDIAPEVPHYLNGDPNRLGQILINLMGNAIKFTDQGKVITQILLEQQQDKKIVLKFRVSDTGIGISEEHLGHLFKSFSQADSSTTRKYGGTGLGLVIAKQLVEMMEGTISVESQPNVGTTFTFTVSLQKGEEPQCSEVDKVESNALEIPQFDGLKVLLAEDDETNQMVAQYILLKAGAEVTIVANGVEASNAVNEDHFDLVLMDIQMPVMDGYEATQLIRNAHSITELPIIAMTANAMKGVREKVLAVGMNDFLTKPIEVEKLYQALSCWGAKQVKSSVKRVPPL
ncbi:MAG: response regulator [Gammaproteobacteria bacterium]|nr:response regulator [Gammaproteobacteria bacterium]